jgi:hypothetical protein
MEPTNAQAQGLYRLCYRLTNRIYPGWQFKTIDLIRIDERTMTIYVIAGENLDFVVKLSGGYEP